MLNKITTALIVLVFATLMTWFVFSPFIAPQLWFHGHDAVSPTISRKL